MEKTSRDSQVKCFIYVISRREGNFVHQAWIEHVQHTKPENWRLLIIGKDNSSDKYTLSRLWRKLGKKENAMEVSK